MVFQPFGYGFEVASSLPPDQVKTALRAKMKGWFDPKSGPRGWIVGPFVCLWLSGIDQHGPMLLARIRVDGSGSQVRGRAGSNINGMIWLVMLLTLCAVILLAQADLLHATPLLAGIGFFGLFILWLAHRDRGEAAPLVRFVRRTIETPAAESTGRSQSSLDNVSVVAAKLIVNGEQVIEQPSMRQVAEVVLAMQSDEFIVIEFAAQTYMQTALVQDRFILERRDGGADRHYRASGEYARDEIIAAMTAYLSGRQPAKRLEWGALDRTELANGHADLGKFAYAIGLVFAGLIAVILWAQFG